MKYTILSLFPEIIDAYFSSSIMAKAVNRGIVEYRSVNIRDYALDKHKTCDDAPYGGGPGMLMLPEPLGRALEAVLGGSEGLKGRSEGVLSRDAGQLRSFVPQHKDTELCEVQGGTKLQGGNTPPHIIFLSASGKPFNQAMARELTAKKELILVCGRYEGIDQRIIDLYADEEISVGDYVLSSGEAAALVIIDATYRLVEQVITPASLEEESFNAGLLEYPQYTRPEIYGTLKVPEVLLSGHHENIRRWRLEKQVEKTLALRPDMILRGEKEGLFSAETRKIIEAKRNTEELSQRGEEG